uniref:NADH:ubiquinone reductase (H(+)-translocating) n=1 Tax=Melicertum octocostatum TaxID=323307 RepID=A0A0S2IB58_9CNID|nr:NADH dehydrogenase subunit 2 [Melicertum octocostatum]
MSLINILIFSTISVLLGLESLKTRNYLKIIGTLVLFTVSYFIIYFMVWHINFSSLDYWKIYSLGLVIICFLVIIQFIQDKTFDVYLLNLLVLLGSLIIILCDHLLIIYLGLELQTFSLFVLISKNRFSIKSSEAGLKYFILGALSSGIYLLGLCFFFLSGVSLNIKDLVLVSEEILVIIGVAMILLSFAFKLALFPLHFWIPDIYEGSSWDVIGLLSTLPKISIITIILQIGINSNLLLFCSLLSIIVGTLGALNQTKMKRLLAYSGISHMGFIMLGYNLLFLEGYEVGTFYLIIYILTMLSVFIMILSSPLQKDYYIIELSGLQYINKTLALIWLMVFLSIAGIPPFSGFISKWFILWNALNYGYMISAIIGIIFSAIGAAYYLRIVKITYFQKQSSYLTWSKILNSRDKENELLLILLGLGVYIIIGLIINPSPLILILNTIFYYFF